MSTAKTQAPWQDAGPLPDLQDDQLAGVVIGKVELVVLQHSTGLKVFEGRCPHQGALLAEGELEDGKLVCRNHRWKFDCQSGQREGGKACLKQFEGKRLDGHLWVRLPSGASPVAEAPRVIRQPRDLPGPKGSMLLGNAGQLETDTIHNTLEAWAEEFGPVYTLRVANRRMVVISDPELIATALRERPDVYRRGRRLAPIFKDLGLDGVFSAEAEAWRPQRKLAMRALSHRNLKGFYPILMTMASRLLERWKKVADTDTVLDLQAELMRFTVDVTTMLAFGHDVNTLGNGDDVIQQYLEPVFPMLARRVRAIVPYWRFFRLPRDRHVDRSLQALRTWLAPIIAETRARIAEHPELADNPTNFLESMLTSEDEKGQPFSDEKIFGNSMTMLLAGEDTTANTLAWAVHHLLDAPESVAQLVSELDATLGAATVPQDATQAGRLPFASAIANETMRVRPVAPLLFADCVEPCVLGDIQIDEKSTIALLMRPAALADDVMPEGKRFKPERWLDPSTAESAQRKQVFMPFGSGPRICPGRSLALLEMNVVLATLYKNFSVERVGESSEVHEVFSFAMAPVGLRVKLRSRSEQAQDET
jgi:cytochrome P450/nitrite reductase/ring-hydroxylating ferredoxin subunit